MAKLTKAQATLLRRLLAGPLDADAYNSPFNKMAERMSSDVLVSIVARVRSPSRIFITAAGRKALEKHDG